MEMEEHEIISLNENESETINLLDDNENDNDDHDVEFICVLNCSGLAKEKFETPERHAERVKELSNKQKALKKQLEDVGIEVIPMGLLDMDIMWGITASRETLMRYADRIRFQVPLISDYGGIAPFHLENHHMYQSFGSKFFRDIDRQRLIYLLIKSESKKGGAEIDIEKYVEQGIIKQFFTLHEKEQQKWFIHNWISKFFSRQPIDEIRNYFGEKLAIYFAWIGFYIKWLIPASIIGLILFILQIFLEEYALIISSISSVLISLWASSFSDFWKRKCIARAFRWKVLDINEKEDTRLAYQGEERVGVWRGKDFIDLERLSKKDKRFHHVSLYSSPYRRLLRAAFVSAPTTIVAIAISMILTFLLVSYLPEHIDKDGKMSAIIWAPILNSILIMILSGFYRSIAKKLTNFENHRTDSEWEDSLIVKLFLFEFVNSYFSIFLYAFPWLRGMGQGMTFNEIRTQLVFIIFFIFITRIVIVQTIGILITVIKSKIIKCCSKNDYKNSTMTRAQKNARLDPYTGTMDKYSEIVIQFGYVILFGGAFPAAPICALLNNIIEIRTNAIRFVKFCQRAPSEPAKDIGIYQPIIEILGIISIITNTAFLGFTDSPTGETLTLRLILVLLIENAVLLVKIILKRLIGKAPSKVRMKMAREKFIKEELFQFSGIDETLPHFLVSGSRDAS